MIWIRAKGHHIESGETHPDLQARRDGANACRHFAQKSGAVFKASSVIALASMCAQKLVAEITMTVLHVDELETKIVRESRCALKVVNDPSDLAISKNWIAFIYANAPIEKGMMVENPRFRFRFHIRSTKAAGMRELQTDQKIVGGAASFTVCGDQSIPEQRQLTLRVVVDE